MFDFVSDNNKYIYIVNPVLDGTWIEWNPVFIGNLSSHSLVSLTSLTCMKRNLVETDKYDSFRFCYRRGSLCYFLIPRRV